MVELYEVAKTQLLAEKNMQDLTAALLGTISEHSEYLSVARDRFIEEEGLGRRLSEFAIMRGDDLGTSRWGNWRSFIGAEDEYNRAAYENFVVGQKNADPPVPDSEIPTYEQWAQGLVLETSSPVVDTAVGTDFFNGDGWKSTLLSDDRTATTTIELGTDTPADPEDDRTVEIAHTRTLTDAKTRENRFVVNGVLDREAMMRSLYYENLGNNYLDAISKLNSALTGVFASADLAGTKAEQDADLLASFRDKYKVNQATLTEATDLVELQQIKSDQETRLAQYGNSELQARQNAVSTAESGFASAAKDYAGAGRRKAMLSMDANLYKDTILEPAYNAFQAADAEVNDLKAISEELRLSHAGKSRELMDAMNRMADLYDDYTEANNEYETRRAVYDYANTPYLTSTGREPGLTEQESTELKTLLAKNAADLTPEEKSRLDELNAQKESPGVADAELKYQIVLSAYESIQKQLAAVAVKTQDRLEVFNAVVQGVADGKTYAQLTTDDIKEMFELQERKHSPGPALSNAEKLELTTLLAKDPATLTENEKTRLKNLEEKQKARSPLTAEEETRLTSLIERDVYNRYRDVILTRADYIEQTLRQVRLEKANAIIQAEIEKRRITAQEKKNAFLDALNTNLPYTPVSCGSMTDEQCQARKEEVENARITVYRRLLQQNDAGGSLALYNEYRSWYYASNKFGGDVLATYQNSAMSSLSLPALPKFGPKQTNEWAMGEIGALSMPADDRAAVLTFLAHGGYVAEFQGSFAPQYYSYMQSLGQVDNLTQMVPIAMATAAVMAYLGAAMIAASVFIIASGVAWLTSGLAYLGIGTALLAGIITAPAAPPNLLMASIQIAAGVGQIAAGTGMMLGGLATIAGGVALVQNAIAQVQMAETVSLVTQLNNINGSTANSALKIRSAEDEYLKAQAELDYFTKVKDMKTLKERMIAWGSHHDDDMDQDAGTAEDDGITEDLYRLTEDDLAYLAEDTTFTSSSGGALTVSSKVSGNRLDVASEKKEAEFADAFGLHYDPETLTTTQPGPLSEGAYVDGSGGRWTRVLTLNHDGTLTTQYARLVHDTGKYDEDEEKKEGYDMGRILQMLVDHGSDMRQESKDAYLAAGNDVVNSGGDMGFILRERDQTIGEVYNKAGADLDGGFEYAGYGMAMADYADNTTAILNMELDQKASLQRKEWDLRAAELANSRQEWEDKMAAILTRGRKGWIASEDRFLAEWRKWTKEYDRDVEAGIDEWEQKIDQHFTDKAAWEDKIRKMTTEANIADVMGSAIDDLNKQLEAAAENLKVNFNGVNKLRAIDDMIAEVRSKDPAGVERLERVNQNISSFSTLIAISEMRSTNHYGALTEGGEKSLLSEFRSAMDEHKKNMKVYANAKAYESYQKMLTQLIEQIDRQNDQVEMQTRTTALSAGFVEIGGKYVKKSGSNGFMIAVDPYARFDGKAALDKELGPNLKSAGEIVEMLKTKDDVEIEAFFYTQRLMTQAAFERIVGRGNAAERKTDKSEETIGKLGVWIGGTGDSDKQKLLTEGLGNSYASVQGPARSLAMNALSGGFGELGASGIRPGGAPMGFYVQLQVFGSELAQQEAKGLMQNNGTFTNMFAGGAIGYQMGMAYYNTRVQTEVYGASKGKTYKAASIQVGKAITKTASAYVAMTVGGWAGFAIGASMLAAAETINDNGTFSMNSQKGMALGIGLVGVALAAYGGSEGHAADVKADKSIGESFQNLSTGVNTGTSLASSGFQWDENGNQKGVWGYRGGSGEVAVGGALLSSAFSYGASKGGMSAMLSNVGGTALSTSYNGMVQYQKFASGHSNNLQGMMASGDWGLVGSLLGGVLTGVHSDNKTRAANKELLKQLEEMKEKNPTGYAEIMKELQDKQMNELPGADDFGKSKELRDVVAGYVRRKEEETQKVLNSAYGSSTEAALDLLRAAWAADGRLGEKNLASMEAGAAMRRVLAADIEMITGGERALTVGEAMMLADKYGFDAKHLFSEQTQAQAQIFATTNYSSAYQAQVAKEKPPMAKDGGLQPNGTDAETGLPVYYDGKGGKIFFQDPNDVLHVPVGGIGERGNWWDRSRMNFEKMRRSDKFWESGAGVGLSMVHDTIEGGFVVWGRLAGALMGYDTHKEYLDQAHQNHASKGEMMTGTLAWMGISVGYQSVIGGLQMTIDEGIAEGLAREALATSGMRPPVGINGATRTVPLGFDNPSQFYEAASDLQTALRNSGIDDAVIGARGSSVEGWSSYKGTPFGPQSDIDVFFESRQITEAINPSSKGFIHPDKVLTRYPALRDW